MIYVNTYIVAGELQYKSYILYLRFGYFFLEEGIGLEVSIYVDSERKEGFFSPRNQGTYTISSVRMDENLHY